MHACSLHHHLNWNYECVAKLSSAIVLVTMLNNNIKVQAFSVLVFYMHIIFVNKIILINILGIVVSMSKKTLLWKTMDTKDHFNLIFNITLICFNMLHFINIE